MKEKQKERKREGKTHISNGSPSNLRLNLRPVLSKHIRTNTNKRVLPSTNLHTKVENRLRVLLAVASGEVFVLSLLVRVRGGAVSGLARTGGGRGAGLAGALGGGGRGGVVADFGAAATVERAVVFVILVGAANLSVYLRKGGAESQCGKRKKRKKRKGKNALRANHRP
jgi:hypothetical protein